MRRKKKKAGAGLLWLSIGGSVAISMALATTPWIRQDQHSLLRLAPSLLLWLGLAALLLGQILLEMQRRAFFRHYRVDRRKFQKPRCGALSFLSNRSAAVADVAMPICIVGTVLSLHASGGAADSGCIWIGLTFLAVSMHCILNGRNFLFVHNQHRVRQVLEQAQMRNTK